jgi:hypothetical protein
MSWQIDPDTGEEYWVDDEPIGPEDYADYGGETITIPDRPPRPEVGTPAFMSDASDRAIYDIKQASQSEKYADTDYGKMRAAERESIMIPPMPQPKYAVDESGDTPSPPDDRIFAKLIGYGGRIATQKNPVNQEINDDLSGDWTDEWGNKLEPKQVKDIYDTTNLTEDEVTAKIRREMPQRPSDDKLSQWEKWDKFYKQVKPQIESEATSRAEEAKTRVNNSFYGMMANSDISLMKPSQHAEISSRAAAAYNSTFQHVLDKETSLAQTAFTRELERSAAIEKQQAEYAKRREDKLSDQAVRNEARLDDRTKTYLGTLRTEQADIGKELRGVKSQLSKFGITSPDVIPPTLAKNEMIMGIVSQYQQAKDQYESIEDKIKGIILNKPSEAKELESGQNVKTKSSGYTDADVGKIIIKNGKKFIVRKR